MGALEAEEDNEQEVVENAVAKLHAIQVYHNPEPITAFLEIEEEKVASYGSDGNFTKWSARLRRAEVQYTHNIEEILKALDMEQKSLEVTHNVSLKDVKKNLPKWVESAKKEYSNLKDNKRAFVVKKFSELPHGCRIVQCKGVYTVKPDKLPMKYRRKTRLSLVACGNHVPEEETSFDLFAAGLDASSLRSMLSFTAGRPWITATTDIRQAFVLAPWLGQAVALTPPSIAYEIGIAEPGDYWLVQMSIYGLRESPSLWGSFRDQQLRLARWHAEVEGEIVELKLEQLVSDDQVWRIIRADGSSPEALGYLMVYIDDLLVTGLEQPATALLKWVEAKWECDSPSFLDYGKPLRFLGLELHKIEDGYEISQEGFIKELLRSHNHQGGKSKTQGPRETLLLSDEEEQALIDATTTNLEGREAEVKEAQRRVGEMLWLSSRSRPDIMYVTALMAAKITKSPDLVNRIGKRLLDYLNETMCYRLKFVKKDPEEQVMLNVFTDSSFAPSGGRSHGAVGVFLGNNAISWRSSRQQLTTLSTCESELLEAVDGITLGLSAKGLIQELCGHDFPIHTWVDNSSSVTLLTYSSGSWGTRHLKLRYSWVKEKINSKEVVIKHISGEFQRADIGTKPMTKDRLMHLISLWGMIDRRPAEVNVKNVHVKESWLKKLILLCQVCGAASQKEHLAAEIPWDLYVAVLVLAVAVIGIWEGAKQCGRMNQARLKALRIKANKANKKLTKDELKELQRLLAVSHGDLLPEQHERIEELRGRFERTMPGSSPVPTVPLGGEDLPSSSSSGRNKQPKPTPSTASASTPTTRDQGTQADLQPAFQRVEAPPIPEVRMYASPFYHVPGGVINPPVPGLLGSTKYGSTADGFPMSMLCRDQREENLLISFQTLPTSWEPAMWCFSSQMHQGGVRNRAPMTDVTTMFT